MYYSEELIKEIKDKNEIVSIISEYIELNLSSSTYIGLCPFHNENTPSFIVNKEKQIYNCIGCGESGDVFLFIMNIQNWSFDKALKYLADRAGIELEINSFITDNTLKETLYKVNKTAAHFYSKHLQTPHGAQTLDYLKERKLTSDTINEYKIGCSEKFGDHLYRYLRKCGYNDDILKMSGLIAIEEGKKPYDKFWDRAIFPILDIKNRVIGFGGRIVGNGSPKYLNSPETLVFDKGSNLFGLYEALKWANKGILLCEGFVDVIMLHQAGFRQSVASLGTALTEVQATLLRQYTNIVYLVYDSDEAGIKATLRAIPLLENEGIKVKIVNMCPYKDPDEFIKAEGSNEFQNRIDQAIDSAVYEYESLYKGFSTENKDQWNANIAKLISKLVI